jgi:hypothetical protein
MNFKKLLLPPFLPVGFLWVLCGWVFVSEVTGDVRLIDGRPDNAPVRAAVILAMVSPLFYLVFALCNGVDWALDRLGAKVSWLGTAALVVIVGGLLFRVIHAPEVDSGPGGALGAGFGLSFALFVPMSWLRRCCIGQGSRSKNGAVPADSPR